MSPTRRTSAPRKRPDATAVPSQRVRAEAPASRSLADSAEDAHPGESMAALSKQFAELLQESGNLDQESASQLARMFDEALADVSDAPSHRSVSSGRSEWTDAVASLQKIGEISEDESIELTRRLNEALEPLERRETQVALEFSRRLSEDGEESALAWLREQSAKDDGLAAAKAVDAPRSDSKTLSSETVKSRSRRLRGPPAMG